MRRSLASPSAVWLTLVLGAAPQVAAEATLVAEESSGSYETNGRSKLEVRGIRGTISLRLGAPGALRFEGRSLDARRENRSAALWIEDGGAFLLGPGSDVDDEGMLIDVAVPPELRVVVHAADSKLLVSGLRNELKLTGERVSARIRGIQAGVELETVSSQLDVEGVKGLVLGADQTTADIRYVYGPASIDMAGGRLTLRTVDEEIDAYLEETITVIDEVAGRVLLETVGGSLLLGKIEDGAELALEDTPLNLNQAKGATEIQTNAPVSFQTHEGPLTIIGYGAEIKGGQLNGPLQLQSDSTSVVLEELNGDSTIRGTGLELTVAGSKGKLTVETASSQVRVRGPSGEVRIENEFGDVELFGAKALAHIKIVDGLVRAQGLEGPIQVEANGPSVEASWKKFSGHDHSTIRNETGDIRVSVPARGRCFIQAEAPFGKVVSELEGVVSTDDGHTARGEFAGGARPAPQVKKPVLQLTAAGGNVYLGVAAEE